MSQLRNLKYGVWELVGNFGNCQKPHYLTHFIIIIPNRDLKNLQSIRKSKELDTNIKSINKIYYKQKGHIKII